MYRSASTAKQSGTAWTRALLYTAELRATNQDLESTTPAVSQTRETQCVSIPRTLRRTGRMETRSGSGSAREGQGPEALWIKPPRDSSHRMLSQLASPLRVSGASRLRRQCLGACWGRWWGGAPCGVEWSGGEGDLGVGSSDGYHGRATGRKSGDAAAGGAMDLGF